MKPRYTYPVLLFLAVLCISIIQYSCKKNDEQNAPPENIPELEVTFILDSVTYWGYGADLFYKLDIQGGQPPYTINWDNPSGNNGLGPFHINLHYHYNFLVTVYDSIGQECIIDYSFDYLDKVTGTYKCNFRIWEYGSFANYDTSGIANFEVTKSYGDQIEFKSTIFRLDSAWTFNRFYYQGHHIFDFYFYPQKDSINVYIMDGGLGAGMNHEYKGVKISD